MDASSVLRYLSRGDLPSFGVLGPVSMLKAFLTRNGMLHMMFKLGMCAEENRRRLRGFNYLAKVITGIRFRDGIEVTDVDQVAA
jgi:hypothetical protein